MQYTSYQPQRYNVPTENNKREYPPVKIERTEVKPRKHWGRRIAILFVLLLLIATASSGYVAWKFFNSTTSVFGGTPASNAIKVFTPTTLKGEENGRVNVLLVGNSADDPGHPAADLTDSILLLSVDTAQKRAALISIPRDTWVIIPGYGHSKINAAYSYGKNDNFSDTAYPLGGMGLLQKTLKEEMGIGVDYYALINYAAVRNLVDAVGGIDVTIKSSDVRGLYDPNIQVAEGGPLRLSNGPQHLDGQTALNLARARGDPTPDGRVGYGFPRSDLERTEHQRQIFLALKDKIASPEILGNPFKLGKLMEAVGTSATSDMQINEARKLAQILRGIPTGSIASHNLLGNEPPLMKGYNTRTGQSALIPAAGYDDFSNITAYINTIFK